MFVLHSFLHFIIYPFQPLPVFRPDSALAESYALRNDEMVQNLNHSELRNSMLVEEADDRHMSIDQQNEREVTKLEAQWQRRLDNQQAEFHRQREDLSSQALNDRKSLKAEIGERIFCGVFIS